MNKLSNINQEMGLNYGKLKPEHYNLQDSQIIAHFMLDLSYKGNMKAYKINYYISKDIRLEVQELILKLLFMQIKKI